MTEDKVFSKFDTFSCTKRFDVNNKYFEFPDSGNDGVCFSPSSGNILTAARKNDSGVSTFNLNINLRTGEKSYERAIPSYVNWEGF